MSGRGRPKQCFLVFSVFFVLFFVLCSWLFLGFSKKLQQKTKHNRKNKQKNKTKTLFRSAPGVRGVPRIGRVVVCIVSYLIVVCVRVVFVLFRMLFVCLYFLWFL